MFLNNQNVKMQIGNMRTQYKTTNLHCKVIQNRMSTNLRVNKSHQIKTTQNKVSNITESIQNKHLFDSCFMDYINYSLFVLSIHPP